MTSMRSGAGNVSAVPFVFQYEGRMTIIIKKLVRQLAGSALVIVLMAGAPAWAAQKGAAVPAKGRLITPGYLGVYLVDVTPQAAAQLKVKHAGGAEIMGVDRDAPAGKVGLQPHDVIVGVNGSPIVSASQLRNILRDTPAGQTIQLRLIHDGKPKDIHVKLASRAEVEASAWPEGAIFTNGFPVSVPGSGMEGLVLGNQLGRNVRLEEFAMVGCDGLDVESLGKQLASYFGIQKGTGLLVRNVEPDSEAAAAGLRAGDVITAVNGMPSTTLRGWLMVVSQNQGKTVNLKVIRNHKLKLIQYTPGGHRQQSRVVWPRVFKGGGAASAIGESYGFLGWVWTESTVSRSAAP